MKKALLFLGHGSRAPGANGGMYQTMELVRVLGEYQIVEAGFMDLNPPSIYEGAANCVRQGAAKIVLVPYFLHLGRHVQKDLPRIVEELKRLHPGVDMVLGRHIGYHPKLAEVVLERIREADGEGSKGEPAP